MFCLPGERSRVNEIIIDKLYIKNAPEQIAYVTDLPIEEIRVFAGIDDDCPSTTLERAVKFKRVNSKRKEIENNNHTESFLSSQDATVDMMADKIT